MLPNAYLNTQTWLERDSRFIRTQDNLIELLDLLLQRGFDSHRFLRGTGVFYEDIFNNNHQISPIQYHQLVNNIQKLRNSGDVAFLFGERQLQNNFNLISNAINNAENLQNALELLQRYSLLITPLWRPYLYRDQWYTYICWQNSFGNNHNNRFLMEASCGLISQLCYRICDEKPDWHLYFQYPKPDNVIHYQERFAQRCHFTSLANVIQLKHSQLHKTNQHYNQTTVLVAEKQCQQMIANVSGKTSILDCVYQFLLARVRNPPNLESTAVHLNISPATLKRKLKQHDSSYQQLLDLSRSRTALYLIHSRQYNNEQVAKYLNFQDTRNFRRSFKRWTGLVPSALRQQIALQHSSGH